MSKNSKLSIALEIVWYVTFVICSVAAVHQTLSDGFKKGLMFVILAVLSLAMGIFRRYLRKTSKD